ncbi:hypothetical protein TI39_contig844g00001 [Zymoseptoria brevis]|uniref:Transcription elongation factor Eaf N-terminal domain-containing protein n=1 Tax=Zymoseptoria brevis TaxID=1047168 RepID=A0A0F4GF52_9PEZI|nr:hypothetical protein TI39_contig844g00001 [Zymoseptoria brevis]
MATATMSSSTFDLKSQATYPIRLGASILNDDPGASRYTSVRYNHKPRLHKRPRKVTISAGSDVGLSKLSLDSDDGSYAYAGRHVQDEDSYVLVFRGEGKDKEMVLERLSSLHTFNLTRTPTETDAAKLASKYPPLTVEEADEGDLFGDGDEDMPADESNPFDYRHFLKAESEAAKNANGSQDIKTSTAPTPRVQAQAARSTPVTRPAAKKRKPAAAPKANPKRVKAGQEPSPEPESASQKPKPNVPKLLVDRKAPIRRLSIEDSGELILENETPINEKPPKHSMALALGGQLGTGPISLRSAASSPGHVQSPAQQAEPEASSAVYEFELGDSSPEPEGDDTHHAPRDEDEEGDAGEEDDDDADVDDLELPSPAQTQRHSVGAAANAAAVGDDDDDLDKQLALAMMEDDDGSEESEEE